MSLPSSRPQPRGYVCEHVYVCVYVCDFFTPLPKQIPVYDGMPLFGLEVVWTGRLHKYTAPSYTGTEFVLASGVLLVHI